VVKLKKYHNAMYMIVSVVHVLRSIVSSIDRARCNHGCFAFALPSGDDGGVNNVSEVMDCIDEVCDGVIIGGGTGFTIGGGGAPPLALLGGTGEFLPAAAAAAAAATVPFTVLGGFAGAGDTFSKQMILFQRLGLIKWELILWI
jgi:hypothetical protein